MLCHHILLLREGSTVHIVLIKKRQLEAHTCSLSGLLWVRAPPWPFESLCRSVCYGHQSLFIPERGASGSQHNWWSVPSVPSQRASFPFITLHFGLVGDFPTTSPMKVLKMWFWHNFISSDFMWYCINNLPWTHPVEEVPANPFLSPSYGFSTCKRGAIISALPVKTSCNLPCL
jgi:hypothetical protein